MHVHVLLHAASIAFAALSSGGADDVSQHTKRTTEDRVHILPISGRFVPHPDGAAEQNLEPRLDIPGVDLDDLTDQVWDKVKSEFDEAKDAAEKGLKDAAALAEKTFDEAVDAAEKVLSDIKDAVEEAWDKIHKKVAELEAKVTAAFQDWIDEHIVEPLQKALFFISLPFIILFTWCILYHIAKCIERREQPRQKKANPNSVELTRLDRNAGTYQPPSPIVDNSPNTKRSGVATAAHWIVRSWESTVQGVLCLLCPWYGSFTLWRSKNAAQREARDLAQEVALLRERTDTLQRNVEWLIRCAGVPEPPSKETW